MGFPSKGSWSWVTVGAGPGHSEQNVLGFRLEENWALSTPWVCSSVKYPAQAAHWEVLEVWPGPAELRVGTQAELRPFCAVLCFTLTLLRGGSSVWQPEQRNSESGLCLWLC